MYKTDDLKKIYFRFLSSQIRMLMNSKNSISSLIDEAIVPQGSSERDLDEYLRLVTSTPSIAHSTSDTSPSLSQLQLQTANSTVEGSVVGNMSTPSQSR